MKKAGATGREHSAASKAFTHRYEGVHLISGTHIRNLDWGTLTITAVRRQSQKVSLAVSLAHSVKSKPVKDSTSTNKVAMHPWMAPYPQVYG